MNNYSLDDGEELNRKHPDTFKIPSRTERENIFPKETVKLIFRGRSGEQECIERMWVIVCECSDIGYVGILDNNPFQMEGLTCGDRIEFRPEHIIQIWSEPYVVEIIQ